MIARRYSIGCFGIGAIDALSFLMYDFQINISFFYVTAIAFKATLCLFSLKRACWYRLPGSGVFCLLCLITGMLQLIAFGPIDGVIQIFVFLVSFAISIVFFCEEYQDGFILFSIAGLFLYFFELQRGTVLENYGRYSYFMDTQPNLGGEFAIALVLMAFLRNKFSLMLVSVVPAFVATVLLQSRSASLVIILFCLFFLAERYEDIRKKLGAKKEAMLAFGALTIGIVASIFPYEIFFNVVNDIFLITDDYRGADSGASGRTDTWIDGLETFFNNPIIGGGLDYNDKGILPPHDFFIYALAGFGSFGLMILICLIFVATKVLRGKRRSTAVLISVMPALILNARFLNLNVYPFELYVFLFAAYGDVCLSERNFKA